MERLTNHNCGGRDSPPTFFITMNIWDAYCKPAYYNIYFDTLVAKGLSREEAEKLKDRYCKYLQRIKECRFGIELRSINDIDAFHAKLKEMFEVSWKGNLKYEEMPAHYYAYLTFLDSMQALHNDFVSDREKARLIDDDPDIPIANLTFYETDYMVNGKLVALMSPQLLFILKEYIEEEKVNEVKASRICQIFYGDLLPEMKLKDFKELLKYLWSKGRKVKKGGKHNQITIRFPDNRNETLGTLDALKEIVKFYGPENVRSLKSKIRGEDFIVKYVPMGKDKLYDKVDESYFINILGATKDRMNIARFINIHFGNKLVITMV